MLFRSVNNKLLLEGGWSALFLNVHSIQMPEVRTGDIQITDVGLNTIYGSAQGTLARYQANQNGRFSVSYVTGSHAVKVGTRYQHVTFNKPGLYPDPVNGIMGGRTYTFRNGVPQSVTIYNQPFNTIERTNTIGLFAQDQWTISNLTLNLGVRYDAFNGHTPDVTIPAGLFVPERKFAAVKDAPNYKNLNPRVSGVYDVFGNGKTAIKGGFGKYLMGQGGALSQQGFAKSVAIVTSAGRSWSDANGNFTPD